MITNKELDAIIAAPRPGNPARDKHNCSLFTCYIRNGFWKSMEPKRMIELLYKLKKTEKAYLDSSELAEVDTIIEILKEK